MDVHALELPEVMLRYYKFGSGDPPRVLLTAAIHGDEVTGTYSAYKLIDYLKVRGSVRGTITVVPVVNVLGFSSRVRLNPVDFVDMNRVFPDGAGSAVTKRIVRFVWELATASDYVVDLHCAGLNSYQYVLALYEEFQRVRELTDTIPWDTIVESNGTRGQLFVEANHRGIAAVIIESPGGDGYYSEEWGEVLFETVLGTLVNLGAVEAAGSAQPRVAKTYYGRLVQVDSPMEGFPRPVVEPGARVRKGELLGYVSGKPIYAPEDGRVIRVSRGVYAFSGERVATVAPHKQR